ncbi:hypothetical protein [Paenibacillus tyrfis]|uniref:hypothetical protein n=1 Tax=Paenibacillus tyrfis TaxID=1501230 RepID=UPI00209FC041|nr:hypothetical protein [Paenibacillus tyrfis]MCP1309426.1 hypothetical protein [Paenibacillus tyrfis]
MNSLLDFARKLTAAAVFISSLDSLLKFQCQMKSNKAVLGIIVPGTAFFASLAEGEYAEKLLKMMDAFEK